VNGPFRLFTNTHQDYLNDWANLLSQYSTLDDEKKARAHYFDSGIINGSSSLWGFVVQPQIARDSIVNTALDFKESVKLLFAVFNAYLDGLISEALNKVVFNSIRPTSAMQCLYVNQTIQSWAGPYMGVQTIPGSNWQGWFVPGRVNNAGPEYACGHCINFASTTTILESYFGLAFRGNNVTIAKGTFEVEPKITQGNPGFIAGVTDVANTGPNSIGYGPATDIHLGWSTWQDLRTDISNSRIYLGAHTLHSTQEGQKLGIQIGENVWNIVQKMFSGNEEIQCKNIGDVRV